MRRLRPREVPWLVALIPLGVFLTWSIAGAVVFAARAGTSVALVAWLGGIALGVASTAALPDPRGSRVASGRVHQPGSALPLVLYLSVFIGRFGCGAWAAIVPAQATLATAIGIAIGAALTGRLIVAVRRWTPVHAVLA